MGSGFDCASEKEITEIIDMGVAPERIIFANPCKQIKDIKTARSVGVKICTFDNEEELEKLKKHWPDVELILRIATDDSTSLCQFSNKFGAPLVDCSSLLEKAQELQLNVIGVSFHIGSGGSSAHAFGSALQRALQVWKLSTEFGFDFKILDIGGGFLASDSFEEICHGFEEDLNSLFPTAKIIAEPGRYFASKSHKLAANVYSKRTLVLDGETEQQLYINDGVYQSFNCLFFDHAVVEPIPLHLDTNARKIREKKAPLKQTTIFGPTCDGLDCIASHISFPEMTRGEWIYFNEMGAYTIAAASSFNGFYQWRIEYYTSYDPQAN